VIKKKRVFILVLGIFVFVLRIAAQSSQSGDSDEETQQSAVKRAIIREQSRAWNWDDQVIILNHISETVKNGDVNRETLVNLECLGVAGTLIVVRENNLIINDFPDIRARAAALLAELGTTEARDILLKMLLSDYEPRALSEIVKSLVNIGINDEESDRESTLLIAWAVGHINAITPDNMLAKSTLDAFETLARNNGGMIDDRAIQIILRIRTGPYREQVQKRAGEVLENIRRYLSTTSS
jgi:HEAT repeat protein